MAECPVSVGDVLADKYRVEKILGHGGMGVVVAAKHLELDQLVAMKFLLPALAENKEAAERFRREARAAVKIRSEHVARVLDVGTMADGVPYMVMEHLEGHDLQSELQERGSLDAEQAVQYLLQACEAIAVAHSVGIVHRDLKPANLFLTRAADRTRTIKVLDFGISKSITGDSAGSMALTRTAAMVGSPLYMSPEQLESARHVDERTDIWALGVILFELVTGSVPFIGDSIPQLVRAVLAADRSQISELVPDLPPELDAIVDRCLALDREKRYKSVDELAQALVKLAPAGRINAQRVSRILNPKKGSVPPDEAVVAAASAASSDKTELSSPMPIHVDVQGSSQPGSSHTELLNPPPPSTDTQTTGGAASWGTTQSPNEAQTQGKGLIYAGISALAIAAAGVVWFVSQDVEQEAEAEPSVGAHTDTVGETPTTGAPDTPLDPAPHVEPSAPSQPLEAEEPTANSSAAPGTQSAEEQQQKADQAQPAALATASASATTSSAPKAAVQPAPKSIQRKPAVKKPTREDKKPKPDFTDFGGRR